MIKRYLLCGMAIAYIMAGTVSVAAEPLDEQTGVVVDEWQSDESVQMATSGTCGEKLTWTITGDATNGYIMTITGSGAMYNYYYNDRNLRAPWQSYRPNIVQVVLDDRMTTIGSEAFCDCPRLTQINIPSGLKLIGEDAFSGSTGLTSFVMPDTVTTLGSRAFADCTGLRDIHISNGVNSIERGTFDGCTSLTVVRLSNNVKYIKDYAFMNCTNLQKVRMPDSLLSIGELAFAEDINLMRLVVPISVNSIGFNAMGSYQDANGNTKNVKGFVIYGYQNSFAQTYARSEILSFQFIPGIRSNIKNFVTRMYTVALGRNAVSDDEVNYWTNELLHGMISAAEVCQGFLQSDEIKSYNLSNEEFVNRCYATLFDRPADDAGFAYWMNYVQNGVTRNRVIAQFCMGQEYIDMCARFGMVPGTVPLTEARDQNPNVTMYVFRCYQRTLGRTPDDGGMNYWTSRILLKQDAPITVAKQIVLSDEFRAHGYDNQAYIRILYAMFFDREADGNGLQFWLEQMAAGASRENLLDRFGSSSEFQAILSSFGL